MLRGAEGIPEESLRRLHSEVIDDENKIRFVLEAARREGVQLESRLNRVLDRQAAVIETIEPDALVLRTSCFDDDQPDQIFLNLAIGGRLYFFSVVLKGAAGVNRLRVGLPTTVFYRERRERERQIPTANGPTRVLLHRAQGDLEAEVADYSPGGLLVNLPHGDSLEPSDPVRVEFLDGPDSRREIFGVVRHLRPAQERPGWRRVGLSTSAAPSGPRLAVERREAILSGGRVATGWRRLNVIGAGARAASENTLRRLTGRSAEAPQLQTLEFKNDKGEHIKAILDGCGDFRGAPMVLIPPAWAKSKETLLPLARTIVETFRRAGESVVVVRIDGIRRRGESFNDPECRAPGRECHHMTFGQGVRDIRATLDYFETAEAFRPSKIVLVTFSGAAIEARRALVTDRSDRVSGWVSVVGAADLKTGLRTVSGGVDYIGSAELGVSLGIQRVLGIEVDADRVAADALTERMAYLEDARRDMAELALPITWIRGRYDAWIDPERVLDMLSCGDASKRRVIEVPTGHQLRSSKEALETFQLIAQEIGKLVLDREVAATLPDLGDLERRRKAERDRLPQRDLDLRGFWSDYLLGRDRKLGMELLTASRLYHTLMDVQIGELRLEGGQRIADLGSGTGAFLLQLAEYSELFGTENAPASGPLEIHEIDFVHEAFERARRRLATLGPKPGLKVRFIECDLALGGGANRVPVEDETYDGVLASLLMNYVDDPARLLAESFRMLRRGGRIVLSTLRRDTDISRIWKEISSEMQTDAPQFGGESVDEMGESMRSFLNEAARLIDFEESGVFHFWDADELEHHLRAAGFRHIDNQVSFGNPPQAIVVSAQRP